MLVLPLDALHERVDARAELGAVTCGLRGLLRRRGRVIAVRHVEVERDDVGVARAAAANGALRVDLQRLQDADVVVDVAAGRGRQVAAQLLQTDVALLARRGRRHGDGGGWEGVLAASWGSNAGAVWMGVFRLKCNRGILKPNEASSSEFFRAREWALQPLHKGARAQVLIRGSDG